MKVGMIGTNFVSDFYMEGIKEVEGSEVVAVCDITMDKANAFADKYNIEYRFDAYQKMYDANIVEAVYIAVPNGLHLEISKYFLERKIPVHCEKPLAGNYREVKEMIDCAKENKTYLHEGLMPLFNPNLSAIKDALKDLGPIHQVTFNYSKYSSRYDAYLAGENPTTFRSELANGAIMDLGVYPISVCVGLFGAPKKVMSASSLLDTGADVSGVSIFVYDDFNVSISYSKASDTSIESEICGENGTITIDVISTLREVYLINRATENRSMYDGTGDPNGRVRIGGDLNANFSYQIKSMADSIKAGKTESDLMTFDISLAIHKAITECREQAGIVYPCDKK